MSGPLPEESVRDPSIRQEWSSLTFLHWSYDPAALRPLIPSELELDTYDGQAWVGLTPFRLVNFRLSGLPPLGPLSTFPETNVRTYVRGPDGRDGLWFFSLEADSLPTVAAVSCLYRLPYRWAAMSVEEGVMVRYRSRRRLGPPAGHDIAVRPGRPYQDGEAGPFDHWLTGRWRAYSRIAGCLVTVPVQHPPWPLWHAEVERLDETLMTASGLPPPSGAPVVHYSPGVDIRLGVARPVAARSGVPQPPAPR